MQMHRLLALLTITTLNADACLAGADLDIGISLYSKGDYAAAASFLMAAVKGADAKNPTAHYYLANTCLQLKLVDEAMQEFRQCYKMAPSASTAPLCLQAIRQFGSVKPHSPTHSSSAAATPAPPAHSAAPAPEETDERAPSLPSIPTAPPESPTITAFLEWELYDQAIFLTEAQSRKERVEEQLQQAEECLTKVESLLSSCLPTQARYGESAEQFQKRRERGKARYDGFIAPYKAEVEKRKKVLEEANTIIQTSATAKATLKMK
jgi:tetratricopeptide (TPR) repeat protein